ncbi:YveK family protein [Cohnella thermotolerans]|uniref:YveK family protein n=1 Tax=Cohnella thermotolerans TaxID=329858 RepID=UPI0003F8821B|nr:Wzz/FepE/Etk N-terminal domain-containing protein [Cohnella thermotolerans]
MELKQYLMVIRKRFWFIAAIVIVVCALAGVKSYLFTTPIYEANAKIIVNQTSESNGAATVNYSDVQTNIMLINSYKEIIKSSAIMNKVKEEYPDIKESPASMAYSISVSASNQSQVMNLTYRDASYKEAAKIVNAIATVFKLQIPSIMKVDNITILNQANENDRPAPVNTNPVVTILIAFVLSLLLSLGIVFLMDYLDHSYKTALEVEADLGLPVLASVVQMKKSDRKRLTPSQKQKVGDGAYATSAN